MDEVGTSVSAHARDELSLGVSLIVAAMLAADVALPQHANGSPQWVSIWTTHDRIVPPDSSQLDGAVNFSVQSICGGCT